FVYVGRTCVLLHVILIFGLLKDGIRRDSFATRRSSCSAIEFVERAEERVVGDNVDVDAGAIVVPIFVSERGLGAVLAGDAILVLGQFRFQNGLTRNGLEIVIIACLLFLRLNAAVVKK